MNLELLFAGAPGAIFGIGYDDPTTVGLICMGILLVCIIAGMRVVFAVSFAGIVGLVELIGWGASVGNLGTIPYSKSTSFVLGLLPMFVLIGFLAYHAGMTAQLFRAARAWLAWMPGGLAVASVFATAGFAAVSGASTATTAVFSRVAIPEMLKEGYDKKLAAGVVAAGGTLATLIPPSALLVVYAITVEESVGRLLLAGFLPGIFSAVIYALIIICWVKIKPSAAPRSPSVSWETRLKTLPGVLPVGFVVVVIISAVYTGWATPTEAGALGSFTILLVALAQGMRWPTLRDALMETSKLIVMIFALIWGIQIFSRFLGFSGLPATFAAWVLDLGFDPYLILVCILLSYVVLGMFMDALGLLMLTLPIIYPAAVALNGGVDVTQATSTFGLSSVQFSVWFGIIVVKMAEICMITPPIGISCFVVNGVRPDLSLPTIYRGIILFFVADVLTIAGLLMFPQIVTFLPDLLMG